MPGLAHEDLDGQLVGGVVFHQKNAQVPLLRHRLGLMGCRPHAVGDPEGQDDGDGSALSGGAFDVNAAVHEPHQPLDDGQPQPGPLVAAGEGILDLPERLEDLPEPVRGDADPGVDDAQSCVQGAPVLGGQQLDGDLDPACIGELEGVARQIEEHLPHARLVSQKGSGQCGIHAAGEIHPLVPGRQGEQRGHGVADLPHVEGRHADFHPARLDPGEVEDIREQSAEAVHGARRQMHVLALFLVQGRHLHELEHAHDAVDGRADLVAHVGQELGLGLAGRFGRLLGQQQGVLGLLPPAQVYVDAEQFLGPVRLLDDDVAGEDEHRGAVLAHESQFAGRDGNARSSHGLHVLAHEFPGFGRDDQVEQISADGLLGCEAVKGLRGGVPVYGRTVGGIPLDGHGRHLFEEVAEAGLALLQRLFRTLALADVFEGGDDARGGAAGIDGVEDHAQVSGQAAGNGRVLVLEDGTLPSQGLGQCCAHFGRTPPGRAEADQFFARGAHQIHERRVAVHDGPVAVEKDHAQGRVLEDDLVTLFALSQGLLGLFAADDVQGQVFGHGVEGLGQDIHLPDVRCGVDPGVKVTVADALGGQGHLLESPAHGPAAQVPSAQQGQPDGQEQQRQVVEHLGLGLGIEGRRRGADEHVHVGRLSLFKLQLAIGVDPCHPVGARFLHESFGRARSGGFEDFRLDGAPDGCGGVLRKTEETAARVVAYADKRVGGEVGLLEDVAVVVQTDARQQDAGDLAACVQNRVSEREHRGAEGDADEKLARGEGPGGQGFPKVPGMGEVGGFPGAPGSDEVPLEIDQMQGPVCGVDADDPCEQRRTGFGIGSTDFRKIGQALQQPLDGQGDLGLAFGDVPAEMAEVILGLLDGFGAVVQAGGEDDGDGRQDGEEQEDGQLLADCAVKDSIEHGPLLKSR